MQRLNRRRALLVGAGAAAHVVLVACGKDSGSSAASTSPGTGPSTPPGGSTGSAPTTGVDVPATSAPLGETPAGVPPIGDYDLDGVVRFTWSAPTSSFDPHKSSSSYDLTTLQPVYDRLLHVTTDGVPAPGLATEWEFGPDGAYLDLTLREGMSFHDGAPLDAEAVKANIERGKTLEGSAVVAELMAIERVEVLGPTAVRLHLSEPAAHLPAVLTDRAGMMVSPLAFENPDLDVAPIGAGMYRVTDYQPGSAITFERFEDYWDPDAVRAARIEWTILSDPMARLNALRTGQIDGSVLNSAEVAQAEEAGLNVVRRHGVDMFHVQLNRSYEPFASLAVRQAMNHALDRGAIVEGVVHGLGIPSSQVFPEGYFAFDPETGVDAFPYDPDRARELLTEAGFPDGFEFDLVYQASPAWAALAAAVQGQYAEVGITANLVGVDPVQAGEVFYVRQEGHAMSALWGGRPDPTQSLRLLYTADGFANPGKHTTDAMVAAIDETVVVQSDEERAAAAQAASAQIVADALDVVVYHPISAYGFSPKVLGPDAWGIGRPDFRYVGMAKA